MLSFLKKVTIWQLKLKETESHSPDLAMGPPHSPHLGRKGGPLCPSFRASVSPHHALLECQGFMAQISQDQGDQSLRFQKRISFPTAMGHEGHRQPESGPRRGLFLPSSQGHTGHLPTGTAGGPPPLTLVGPEEQHHPNSKNARIPMGKKGNSKMPRTMRWLALLRSLKDQNKPSSWEIEAQHLSNLEAKEGLCCLSLKDPGEDLLPLSLEVREDHPLAILLAQGGHILVSLKLPGVLIPISLKDPEAKHRISCQGPGGFSLSSLRNKGSIHHRDLQTKGRQHPFSLVDQGALRLFLKKMTLHPPASTSRASLHRG